jgi:protease-4
MAFSDILKNIFYVLLIFTFAQPFIKMMRETYTKTMEPHTKVAYVEIKGMVSDADIYTKQLQRFFQDNEIKAILIKIESLGGVAGSSEALFHEIMNMKKENPKQVAVLVENVCASGAYWVACAADHIVASPVAWVGSIGAYIQSFRLKEFINYHNIKYESPKAGAYKNVTDPFVDVTPEQTAMLQTLCNQTYQDFTHVVANRRGNKLSMNNVNEWANGKIFTGRQALELGLIDELGSKSNAIAWIKEKALIEGKIEWVRPPQPSPWQSLWGQSSDADSSEATVATKIADAFCTKLEQRYSTAMMA